MHGSHASIKPSIASKYTLVLLKQVESFPSVPQGKLPPNILSHRCSIFCLLSRRTKACPSAEED